MKPALLSLSLFASLLSLAAAQLGQLDKIPTCAQGCVSQFTSGSMIADCKPVDIACICRNKDFLNNISCCLLNVCGQAEQEATVKFASQLCSASGVKTPDKPECNGTSSSNSAASSAGNNPSAASASRGAGEVLDGSAGSIVGGFFAILAAAVL